MIKLVIFDCDGVLIEARELHYQALNKALTKYSSDYLISREDHDSSFNGLPTRVKLQKLTETRGLPLEYHEDIAKLKQAFTVELIKETINQSDHVVIKDAIQALIDKKYRIAVCSNAVFESVKLMLECAGLYELIYGAGCIYSNEDVNFPKPNPEIYLRCMADFGVSPKETLIFEDSEVGLSAAIDSCANVIEVSSPAVITSENVFLGIEETEKFQQGE